MMVSGVVMLIEVKLCATLKSLQISAYVSASER